MMKDVRFNNGNGALLCNNCKYILAYGFEHEDKYHYCNDLCHNKHEEKLHKEALNNNYSHNE